MGFVDSFINILEKIKYKLVKMPIPEEDKRVMEKYRISEIWDEKKEEIHPPRIREKHFWSILAFSLFLLFIFSCYVLMKWGVERQNQYTMYLLPIFLFLLPAIIPYFCKKPHKYTTKGYWISLFFLFLIHLFWYYYFAYKDLSFFTYLEIPDLPKIIFSRLILSGAIGTLSFLVSGTLMEKVSKVIHDPKKINKDDFAYFVAQSDIYVIRDVLEKLVLNNIRESERGYKVYEQNHEVENTNILSSSHVISLTHDFLFFYTYEDKKLSFIVLRQEGRFLSIDNESKQIQEKIKYIFRKIANLVPLRDESEVDIFYDKGMSLLIGYTKESKIESFVVANSIRALVAIIVVVVGSYYIIHEAQEIPIYYVTQIIILILGVLLYEAYRKR